MPEKESNRPTFSIFSTLVCSLVGHIDHSIACAPQLQSICRSPVGQLVQAMKTFFFF